MDLPEARRRFAAAPVARLATTRPGGEPHLVPVTFALVGDVVYSAVDAKPKRTRRLQRLANLRHDPRCCLLTDAYDDDWSGLWWVRADGEADILEEPDAGHPGMTALVERYAQYRLAPPAGPLLCIRVRGWRWWSAA